MGWPELMTLQEVLLGVLWHSNTGRKWATEVLAGWLGVIPGAGQGIYIGYEDE